MKTSTDTIHELTRAEIARQISNLAGERARLSERRGELYQRSANSGAAQPISPDERAARAYARVRLNGAAPASLEPPSELNFGSLDRQLAVEQRGIDIAIKILSDKEVAARATEAVKWSEDNAGKWRGLVREIIVASTRLEALEAAATRMLEQCVDIEAVTLPMVNIIGREEMKVVQSGFSGFMKVKAADLIEAGLNAGVITQREIDKAKNV